MGKDYSPKPIEDLMRHLSAERGIEITSEHTRQMLNYGYYHAYKGYRFFKDPKALLPFSSFEQIIAVIDYDNALKAAFYPEIMFLETAIKNIVVANIIEGLPSAEFNEVMRQRMNDDNQNEQLARQRKRMRDKIHTTMQKRFTQNDAIVAHFRQKGEETPIWAIFEIISLGDFAGFVNCLNKHTRISLLRELHMKTNDDCENQLLSHILYTIKDLRNALAHNNVIFDTRFKEREIHPVVASWLMGELGVDNIDFGSIADYFLLVAVLLKKIEYGDEKLQLFVSRIEQTVQTMQAKTPTAVSTKLTTQMYDKKLATVKEYITR